MDSKVFAADAPAPRRKRWLAYARSTASRVLKSLQPTPFDEAVRLNSLFARNPEKRDVRLQDSL
jgi:hypothetical protein